jgi:ATP-dependent DNA helicase PIF1
MELSREQQFAFDKYVQCKNIFITGPGGSGKSALIRKIYKHAYQLEKTIYVTALTGCAAVLLNCKATTLHSWAGIGLCAGTQDSLVLRVKKNKFARAIWRETDILIVDEVSMLSRKMFDVLNAIGKAVRNNNKPFGGIQLIFSGDFYQLPPVGDKDEPETMQFCFESDDWNSVFHRDCQIQFKRIFRQTDEVYATILNQIREGKIKRKSNDLLMKYVGRELSPSLIVEPTKLYPTKNKVMQINTSKMNGLKTEERTYQMKQINDLEMTKSERDIRAQYSQQEIITELNYLAGNLICEKEISIKIGAQVMCVVNMKSAENDILVCNGSQGIVIDYCDISGCPRVKYNNGIEMVMMRHTWISDKIPGIGVSQVPLILAWALTIHKSQGATLDVAEIDVGSGIFECGQTYVALSRVKSLDGLYLTSFDASRIKIAKKVQDYYNALTTFQQSMFDHEEIYVPLVIAEPIQQAIPIPDGELSFVDYQYEEATHVEPVV